MINDLKYIIAIVLIMSLSTSLCKVEIRCSFTNAKSPMFVYYKMNEKLKIILS